MSWKNRKALGLAWYGEISTWWLRKGAIKSFQDLFLAFLLCYGSINIMDDQKAKLASAEISLKRNDAFCSAWKTIQSKRNRILRLSFWQTNLYFLCAGTFFWHVCSFNRCLRKKLNCRFGRYIGRYSLYITKIPRPLSGKNVELDS